MKPAGGSPALSLVSNSITPSAEQKRSRVAELDRDIEGKERTVARLDRSIETKTKRLASELDGRFY